MKDGATILKILSVQNFVKLNKIALYLERVYEYELKKQLHLVLNCFL